MTDNRSQCWKIQPNVDSFTFGQFTECIADIAESLTTVHEICLQGRPKSPSLNRAARNISVAIRKVMLDGGSYLLKESVEPRLHPLKGPKTGRRRGLRPDVLVERLEGMSINYTVGESEDEKTFAAPAYEHRTVVYPLYGLRRSGKEKYRLDDPFDMSAQPMKYGRWLNLRVLQIGDDVLNAERILQLLVNYEGAHAESNELTQLNASLPIDIRLPKLKDELYRRGIWITFGGVSYLHLFSLFVGVYLVNMMRSTFQRYSEMISDRFGITHQLESVSQSPLRIEAPTLALKKQFSTGVVVQDAGNSKNGFELVGDYGKPGLTTIQIPGWT